MATLTRRKILKKVKAGESLSNADLREANLRRAKLSGADLSGADLSEANLSKADLEGADLSKANLRKADLSSAWLEGADLSGANLSSADLSSADLSSADLSYADLRSADLSYADLSSADLSSANLRYADLSSAENLLNATKWLEKNFESDELGIIVYKAFGDTTYPAPNHWTVEPGSFIEEVVHPDPCLDCACGANFATQEWISSFYTSYIFTIWKCRIRWMDLAGVVVPYNTDGKARCSRLELIEPLESEQ